MININLELPTEVDLSADLATQSAQRALRDGSYPEVIGFLEDLVKKYQAENPDIEMHLAGMTVINNTFASLAQRDGMTLVPLMYCIILVLLVVFFRSLGSVVVTLVVIALASVAAMGSAGWFGYAVNTVSIMAPTIVLTIAVCDAVHLLSLYLRGLGQDLSSEEAMYESMRLNLQPIILTSVTTAVGFLTLNFSPSPPFVELGNITAVGVLWAMVLTFTLMPALSMLLIRRRKEVAIKDDLIERFADFIIRKRVAVAVIALIPLNVIDDDPITYFKKGVPYRDSMEFAIEHLPGVNNINFNVECDKASCISEA